MVTHNMDVQLPEFVFDGATFRISPRSIEGNGIIAKLEYVPKTEIEARSDDDSSRFFKKIKKISESNWFRICTDTYANICREILPTKSGPGCDRCCRDHQNNQNQGLLAASPAGKTGILFPHWITKKHFPTGWSWRREETRLESPSLLVPSFGRRKHRYIITYLDYEIIPNAFRSSSFADFIMPTTIRQITITTNTT